MADSPELGRRVLQDFRRTWPQLAVTDLLAKAAGFVVLTPLIALLLQLFLLRADHGVLSDEEILFFFVRPLGLLLIVAGGSVWAGILFVEQASLMTVGFGAREDRLVSYWDALGYAARHAPRIARLAARMIARVLMVAAPFLVAAVAVYLTLLTDHDINYYLSARPPRLWVAAVACSLIVLGLTLLLLRLAASWFLAVPILLFENASPGEALRRSRDATSGHRYVIAIWVVVWAGATLVVSAILTGIVGLLSELLIPTESVSLGVVALGAGAAFLIGGLGNLLVSFVSGALFALLVVRLHAAYAGPGQLSASGFSARGSLGARTPLRIPRKGVLWSGLAVAGAIVLIAMVLIDSLPTDDEVEIVAHRGGAIAAPENTMAAIVRGIADGTDWVEIDVQESADGVVIVAHDKDFMRASGVRTNVWDAPYDELRGIDIGAWFGPEFAGEYPPTLEEVLLACKGQARVVIELKYYGHDRQLEQRVVDIVESTDMESDVEIMSLKYAGVLKTRALRPNWSYGLLSAVAVGNLARLDVDFLAVNASQARRRMIRAAHRRGKRVYVWTVNDPVQMSALISKGVDAIITDDPAAVRAVLNQHAEMSPVERLLVELGVSLGLLEGTDESSDASDA